jgi:hypothetical protein
MRTLAQRSRRLLGRLRGRFCLVAQVGPRAGVGWRPSQMVHGRQDQHHHQRARPARRLGPSQSCRLHLAGRRWQRAHRHLWTTSPHGLPLRQRPEIAGCGERRPRGHLYALDDRRGGGHAGLRSSRSDSFGCVCRSGSHRPAGPHCRRTGQGRDCGRCRLPPRQDRGPQSHRRRGGGEAGVRREGRGLFTKRGRT